MPRVLCLVVIALSIVLVPSGCADIPSTLADVAALRDDAARARDHIAAELSALEGARADLPAHAPPAPDLDAAIAAARAKVAALDAGVLHADRILAEMAHPTDALTQGVGVLSPLLPPPVQGPVLFGAALAVTLLRARQVRKGAGSIVASIQNALKDPAFRDAFERHADTIRSIQTPTARRIVDEVTKPGLMLRSPI